LLAGNAGDAFNLNHSLGWDALPLEDSSTGQPKVMSDLRTHATLGADEVHTSGHKDRLLPGSGLVQSNSLPQVYVVRATVHLMEIGDRIRRARLAAGMSQRELATAVGVTHGLVGQWESHRKSPGRENLRKIAEITLSDPAELLSGNGRSPSFGVHISDLRQIALIRRFVRLSPRQQENLLELMGVAGDVRRELQHASHPVETQ